MLKKRTFILYTTLLVFFLLLFFIALSQAKTLRRDPTVLMNQFYRFRSTKPEVAERALLIILKQDKYYLPALKELSHLYLSQGRYDEAIPLLRRMRVALPRMESYIPDSMGPYFSFVEQLPSAHVYVRQPGKQTESFHSMQINSLPSRIVSPEEKGYRAIAQGHTDIAIKALTYAYRHNPDSKTAMQLAYLYDSMNNKPMAYQYFSLAAKSSDPELALDAQRALTNLACSQTKAWPEPYFTEVFFSPFSQSRFGLTVRPFVARAGMEHHDRLHSKQYVVFRRTDDNQSEFLGQISQLYEDDVQIIGVGQQITPWPTLPIVAWIEAGQAYDLVYQSRNRFRGDLRGGLMYYQAFGAAPSYYKEPLWGCRYYGELYGDITYFSRYDNNVIGFARTRQGIRLLQYRSSMLNLYVTGRVFEDTNRYFFNNLVEVGPGISFVPTNRWNVEIRYEHINGMYLPAGSSYPNPYNKYYTNDWVFLQFYVKL